MMAATPLTVLFLLELINALNASETTEFQKNLPAQIVWAQEGGDAELPCDVEPSGPGDRINMILWFKDSTGIPLYSVDGRYGGLERASHGAMTHDLGQRSNFDRGPPARLRVSRVKPADQGVFRCRVDFLNSPTRNYRVNLTLITPPQKPKIYNLDENTEMKDTAGPYKVGHDIRLVCIVTGGHPSPEVSWWLEDKMLESRREHPVAGSQVAKLQLGGASLHLHGRNLSCQARSARKSCPVVTHLVIRIYLKPNKVEIVSPQEMLSAGQVKQVVCEAYGSFPAANLTWYLDGDIINYAPISVVAIGNTTRSTLSLKPVMEDDGKELTCRAVNPKYPAEYIETRRTISVAYAALAEVRVLSGPLGGHVREGSTVKLGCKLKSNPPPDSILWYHESELLRDMGTELNLGPVSASSAGDYFCFVRNREGATRSKPLKLTVQYTPFCKPGTEVRTVGAMVGSTVKAVCEVQAASEDLKFRWTFNRSREVMAIPAASVHSLDKTSYVSYKANTEYDFGTLACWAMNSVGHQKVPCVIHLILASLPKKPEDCTVQNKSKDQLEIECSAGDSGGLPQQFLLQVVVEGQLTPAYKLISFQPKFIIHGLEPKKRYDLHIYAKNALGLSDGAILSGVLGPAATERLTGREKEIQPDYWLAGGVAGVAGIALLGSILTFMACRKKQNREDVPLNNLGPSIRIRYPGENNSDYYSD